MSKVNKSREILKEMSRKADEIRAKKVATAETEADKKFWLNRSVNWILLHEIYEVGEATEFKPFEQWKREGATVRRNQKAFVILGQLVEADEFSFHPLVYLFSNLQVYKPQHKEQEQPEPEQKPDFNAVNGDDL